MKALVYLGPKEKAVQERPMPVISEPTDAIVKMVLTTICGTDLHILKGDVPTCQPGRQQRKRDRSQHPDQRRLATLPGIDLGQMRKAQIIGRRHLSVINLH